MKIIDGEGCVLGRLASFAAKEALKGEEIIILNCEKVIITGNKENINEKIEERRKRHGDSQKGPIYPRQKDRIVKRAIRGMLPDHRKGRGKEAYKRIKCYTGIPKEYENKEKIKVFNLKKDKYVKVEELK